MFDTTQKMILLFDTFSKDAKIVIGKIAPQKMEKMKEGAKNSNYN